MKVWLARYFNQELKTGFTLGIFESEIEAVACLKTASREMPNLDKDCFGSTEWETGATGAARFGGEKEPVRRVISLDLFEKITSSSRSRQD